jgi:hypothetical protein
VEFGVVETKIKELVTTIEDLDIKGENFSLTPQDELLGSYEPIGVYQREKLSGWGASGE